MSAILPECPNCEKEFELGPAAVGKKIQCGDCGVKSRIHVTDGGTLFLTIDDEDPVSASAHTRSSPMAAETSRWPGADKVEDRSLRQARKPERPASCPAGVTVLAMFDLLAGLAFLAFGVIALLGAVATASPQGGGQGSLSTLLAGMGVVYLLLGIGFIALAVGLLRGAPAARGLRVGLSVVGAAATAFQYLQGYKSPWVIPMIGLGLMLNGLLFTQAANAWFSGAPRAPKGRAKDRERPKPRARSRRRSSRRRH
ncbi:MAG: hypothetical protein KDB53_04155 [Planctomycetes bacterium]|nr:hypothetical protein [Planctomycetota bacterium]